MIHWFVQADLGRTLAGVKEALHAVDELRDMVIRMEEDQREQRALLKTLMELQIAKSQSDVSARASIRETGAPNAE